MKKSNNKLIAFSLFIILISVYILAFPQTINKTIVFTLNFCYNNLIPSLFPFLVISQITAESNLQFYAGKIAEKPIKHIFGIDKVLSGSFVIGMISGFPSGARSVGITYKKGLCNKKQAEQAVALSNNASPAFLISAAGAAVFGKISAGIILFISQILSLILTAQILKFTVFSENEKTLGIGENKGKTDIKHSSFSKIIAKSIGDSTILMITICGFVIFFSVLSQIVQIMLPTFLVKFEWINTITTGFFEISSGVFASGRIPQHKGLLLCSAIIGWSGMSVLFQIIGICSEYNLSAKAFVLSRLLQAVFCPLFVLISIIIFPRSIPAFTYITETYYIREIYRWQGFYESLKMSLMYILSMILFFSLICLFARLEEKRRNIKEKR